MEELTFSTFTVRYHYRVNTDVLDSWEDRRMTGFQVSWTILDYNGSQSIEEITNTTSLLKPQAANPIYQDQQLLKMVQLAGQARIQNINREEVNKITTLEKAKLIKAGKIHYNSMCSGGQIRPNNYDVLQVTIQGLNKLTDVVPNDEDIHTGFMLFYSLVYCSESVQLYQFLHSLLSNQSPRTIIQATVNTIEADSDAIKESSNRKRLAQFYIALDQIFLFKYGKILLALSSPSELESMLAKGRPYFSHFSQEIDHCLSGASCQGVMDLVQTLGKPNPSYYTV